MRRAVSASLGILFIVTASVAIWVLPASAASNVTLSGDTCGSPGPDVTLNGTWNAAATTCTVSGFASIGPGSTLTVPLGTTLADTSPTYPFDNDGTIVNSGAIEACLWNDFGTGATQNQTSATFEIAPLASCRSSEHEVYIGGSFSNRGTYTNSGTLVVDGFHGGATFTNFCGSIYTASGVVDVTQGGVLILASGCPQTITASAPTTGQVGGGYTVAASASSGLPVALALDATSAGCTLAGTMVSFTGAGTCVVDATQSGDTTFAAAPEVQLPTAVSLLAQTITASAPTTGQVGGGYTVAASASSGLPVALALDATSAGCTLAGTMVSFTGAGTCVIDATQPGDTTFAAAPAVQLPTAVSVVSESQSITFGPLPDRVVGTPPFSVSASASSGLPVTLSSLTPSVCSVAGTTVRPLATGTCSLEATQGGDANWQPAAPVTQSFEVFALLRVCLPRGVVMRHGNPLFVVFSLDDARYRPLPSAIASTAAISVTFGSGQPATASYVPFLQEFTALLPGSRLATPGRYPVTFTSTTPAVPIPTTTIWVTVDSWQQWAKRMNAGEEPGWCGA